MDTLVKQELLKLEPNSTYVLEVNHHMSSTSMQHLNTYLEDTVKDPSIKFLILTRGMKLAKSTVPVEKTT